MDHYFFTAENPAEGAAFSYHLGSPAQKVRLIVSNASGKVIRSLDAPATANAIHRVNWDLRYPVPIGIGRVGGGGGEEGGGTGGPGSQKPGVIQLPVPSHEIGARGPHVAPGTFKVTLEVDGTAAGSQTFEVRADSGSSVTLAQHKAREAFSVEVIDLLARIDTLSKTLAARRDAASGEEAARLQALEQRLVGGGGGRGRGGAPPAVAGAAGGGRGRGAAGGPPPVQPVRTRLAALINAFTGSGARTGTLAAPTGTMTAALAEAKMDLAAIEKEFGGR
jgi:hypothetical protein